MSCARYYLCSVSVLESSVVGSTIGEISVTDTDVTSVLVYTLDGASADFAINSATGQVLVARPLGLTTTKVVSQSFFCMKINFNLYPRVSIVRIKCTR